jgi:hypothetical protein
VERLLARASSRAWHVVLLLAVSLPVVQGQARTVAALALVAQ